MIKSEYYRVAEFKIIEGEDGYLWWETHSGFCSVKMGRCFVSGSILFIEPGHISEDNGFLKGEFLDKLNQLPKWEKTNYYCANFIIVKCKSDQNRKSVSANNKFSQPTTQEDVSFRLGKFEIVEKRDGKLLWKSYSGREAIKLGKAFVNGNILFLGRSESEKTGIIKKGLLERLLLLPLWEKTKCFCQQYTLYSCETNAICYDLDENFKSNKIENDTVDFRKKSSRLESNAKSQTTAINFTQNHLKPIWSYFSILVLIILKVLFFFSITVFKTIKLFIEMCVLGWEQLKKRILAMLK
jgi:hypothetical protein